MSNMMLLIWIVWAGMVAGFLALLAYRGTITRYEEDQLFLTGSNETEHKEQDEIVRKVNRIEPLVRIFGGAAGVMTVGLAGVYVWDAIQHLT